MEDASLQDYYAALLRTGAAAWTAAALAGACFVTTLLLFADALRHVLTTAPRRLRTPTASVLAVYPLAAAASLAAMAAPRGQLAAEAAVQVVFACCFCQLFRLLLTYGGGVEALSAAAGGVETLDVAVGPCCCWPCCALWLPRPALTTRCCTRRRCCCRTWSVCSCTCSPRPCCPSSWPCGPSASSCVSWAASLASAPSSRLCRPSSSSPSCRPSSPGPSSPCSWRRPSPPTWSTTAPCWPRWRHSARGRGRSTAVTRRRRPSTSPSASASWTRSSARPSDVTFIPGFHLVVTSRD